jgi:serine/threonine protein kinase
MDPAREPVPLPPRIGPYRVVRLIRQGGMALVCEARSDAIDRRVAIKLLRPGCRRGPLEERLRTEAWAANQVQHPALVTIHELGALPCGSPYLVMDYLEGESLLCLLRRGHLGPEGLDVMRQVAAGLAALHGRGLVHRDVKPGNVMVVSDPERPGQRRAKVLDFGLVKRRGAAGLTSTGMVMGTPSYMAPEQWLHPGEVDDRADVYSLGVMLYELLAGQPPFRAPDTLEMMHQHLHQPPSPLHALSPALRPSLVTLVQRMLAKRPAERPAMAQVAEALAREAEATLPFASFSEVARARRPRRGPLLAAGLCAAALLISLGLGLGLTRTRMPIAAPSLPVPAQPAAAPEPVVTPLVPKAAPRSAQRPAPRRVRRVPAPPPQEELPEITTDDPE